MFLFLNIHRHILKAVPAQVQPSLGTIQILRKQMEWVGGLCQMLTFAYNLGGWVIANAYVSKISKYLEKSESLSTLKK